MTESTIMAEDKWIGSGGRSPFGHSGAGRRGNSRLMKGRVFTSIAQKVIDRRNYVNYTEKSLPGHGQLEDGFFLLRSRT